MRVPILIAFVWAGCKEERAVVEVVPDASAPIAVEPTPPPIAATATTATRADAPKTTTAVRRSAKQARATEVRSGLLAKRKSLKERVRQLEVRIVQLEATLKITGPRLDRGDVQKDLGRSRGELGRVRSTHERCERAFGGEQWDEIDAAWTVANDLVRQGETDPADENFQRVIDLAPELRESCEPLKKL
jgi:hypothetical protein